MPLISHQLNPHVDIRLTYQVPLYPINLTLTPYVSPLHCGWLRNPAPWMVETTVESL